MVMRHTVFLSLFTLLLAPGLAHGQDGLEPDLRPRAGLRWFGPLPTEPDPAPQTREGLSVHREGAMEVGDPLHRLPTIDLTADAIDIWDRIRRGFAMPDLDTDLVTEQQIFYLNRPAFLKQVIERGQRYFFYIVAELERRGMPTELALLPMVESAYNPMAYSRAHASGLWQFIPSTGRNYNLTQNSWVDERRDVVASTNAALDYLQNIYEMHGDWHLALASYNWGEGAVGRAIQKNLSAGLPTDYASLTMPAETRHYVPKLQALKNIIAQPELFNVTLPYVANRPYFVTVESPATLDLATAAKMADTPLKEFIALNPAYRKPVIPKGTQSLVVPVDKEAVFRANMADSSLQAPRWKALEVNANESVDKIASRYEISAQELRQINGLASGVRLSAGQTLLVPAGGDVEGALRAASLLPKQPAAASPAPASRASKGGAKRTSASKPAAKALPKKTLPKAGKKPQPATKSSPPRGKAQVAKKKKP